MKIYPANKKGMLYMLMGYVVLLVGFFCLGQQAFTQNSELLLPMLVPLVLILWPLFNTYYQIRAEKPIYRPGYVHGEIDINSIREIIKGKTMWIRFKPSLATGGLIIKFNRFNEIYLAPKNNEELIADLPKLNGSINIIN
ncbi:MAG TPA: PH domain-containing protein [Cyclobacteriaceae bacterium]|nr:PH domain-containing protein [Cyclobacteriaceae bacterium]